MELVRCPADLIPANRDAERALIERRCAGGTGASDVGGEPWGRKRRGLTCQLTGKATCENRNRQGQSYCEQPQAVHRTSKCCGLNRAKSVDSRGAQLEGKTAAGSGRRVRFSYEMCQDV